METVKIKIGRDGTINAIYKDSHAIQGLMTQGIAQVTRASHVEPETTPEGVRWFVDMTPVGGPKLPTGYIKREDALAAEVAWLEENYLKAGAAQ